MAKTRTYNHFCPSARTLEVIGEKWSLLIVRDILRGPRRFTRAGLAVLGGIGLSGMLSLNIVVSLSYQIFVVLVCLLAAATAGARWYRIRFTAERQLPIR